MLVRKLRRKHTDDNVDNLLNCEEAKHAHIKNQKFEVTDGDGKSFLSLIMFGAAISDAVYNLMQLIEWMQTSGQNAEELLQGIVPATTPKEYMRRPFYCGKGGTVPQESADRLKALLPVAAAQFLNHERNYPFESFKGDKSAIRQELELRKGDDEATCLNDKTDCTQ